VIVSNERDTGNAVVYATPVVPAGARSGSRPSRRAAQPRIAGPGFAPALLVPADVRALSLRRPASSLGERLPHARFRVAGARPARRILAAVKSYDVQLVQPDGKTSGTGKYDSPTGELPSVGDLIEVDQHGSRAKTAKPGLLTSRHSWGQSCGENLRVHIDWQRRACGCRRARAGPQRSNWERRACGARERATLFESSLPIGGLYG
jgi:hypothetical protein